VAGLYNAALVAPPPKPIEDKEPKVTARLRGLVENLANGNANPEDYSPEFRAQLFPDHVKQVGEKVKSFGPIKSFVLIAHDEDEDGRVYKYLGTFGNATVEFEFMLDKQSQVAAANFHVN
jgi:hypothetical protein